MVGRVDMYNDFNYRDDEITIWRKEDVKKEFAELITQMLNTHSISDEEAANALRVSKSTIHHIVHGKLSQYTTGQLGSWMKELRGYINGRAD